MKLILTSLLYVVNSFCFGQSFGDSLSVKVEATVNSTAPSIELNWPADADATNFIVYRKLKGTTSWGTALATLPSSATVYTDNSVSVNTLYDYKVQMTSGTTPDKFGYLSSGVEVVANSNRGIAIVVVGPDLIANTAFMSALDEYKLDLELDGWYVKEWYVTSGNTAGDVKSDIINLYDENPAKTKMVVLVGNVPVPYSGNLNPDGHPDHQGAWPADVYYAEIDGNWTDASVNNTSSGNSSNHNTPSDGKLDQSTIPSDVDLQIGRIDLSNLPSFGSTEAELLIGYLNKDHLFKTAQITVGEQALIDDNFASYDEGFSQNGYNNFAALVGRNNIVQGDFFGDLSYTTSTSGTYLWAYGCGPGTYTSAGGIGSSVNFVSDSLSAPFTMLFGSYFGDWNYSDAFLRAPLAQGNTLTCCWAGRPNWYFNHMAMGENIGYSTRLTQNNGNMYIPNIYSGLSRMVTINLMGDPSLRAYYIEQPTNLVITANGSSNDLSWSAGGSEIGYNVYRRYADSVDFVKLNTSLVTATNFSDNTLPVAGTVYYYIKSVEMKISPSGSFENESLGIRGSAESTVGIESPVTIFEAITAFPNPTSALTVLNFPESMIGKTFQLVSETGNLIEETAIYSTSQNLDLTQLPAGIYFVKVQGDNSQSVQLIKG